jgi:hypothetical protein
MSSGKATLGPFPGLPPSPNQTQGAHWGKTYKIKQEWGQLVGYAALAERRQFGPPLERAHVHFDISVGDNRRHDPDNLSWAVTKMALDAIKGHLITDDSIDNVTLSYSFSRTKPRQFSIEVSRA